MDGRQVRMLERLVELAPAAIAEKWDVRQACIASTAIGVKVCRYFGLDAKPLPTRAVAANAEWAAWMADGQPIMEPDELLATGAWSVEIDVWTDEPGRYAGHLVVGLPGERLLLDLNCGQFSRPKKNIVVPDAGVFATDDAFWTDDDVAAQYAMENDGLLAYQRIRNDSFRRSPDWRKAGRTDPVAGALIRQLREETS